MIVGHAGHSSLHAETFSGRRSRTRLGSVLGKRAFVNFVETCGRREFGNSDLFEIRFGVTKHPSRSATLDAFGVSDWNTFDGRKQCSQ